MKYVLLLALLTPLGILSAAPAASVKKHAEKIDQLVADKLEDQDLKPNPIASDEVFVRRAYLNLVGRIPTMRETEKFLADDDAGKRSKLISGLLDSPGYVHHFSNYWGDLLRLKSTPVGGNQSLPGGLAYSKYLKDSLAENKPYDQLVRELLTAEGKTYENGAVGFYLRDYNMQLDNMAVTTQVFLGTQMVCAQCHDHPFDKWSMMDYYEMAAHTYGIRGSNSNRRLDSGAYVYGARDDSKKAIQEARSELGRAMTEILRPLRFNLVVNQPRGLRLPHDYPYDDAKPKSVVQPTIPASFSNHGTVAKEGENPVVGYASWMTAEDNPRFTLVIANRLWKQAMGYGVIEPVDELTDSTVPSNPQLMAYLEQLMKDLDYDMKAFLEVVYNTETFQRETHNEEIGLAEPFYFQGPVMRRMTAEQIWDSMVTLVRHNPDAVSRNTQVQTETLLTRVRWMDDALNALTDKQLARGARKIADLQKKLSKDVRQAQLDLVAAQEAKDEEGIREAKRVVSQQRAVIREAVEDIVYQMGFERFLDLAEAGKLKEQTDPELAAEINGLIKSTDVEALTFEKALATVERALRARYNRLDEAQRQRLKDAFKVTDKSKAAFDRYMVMIDREAVRAAEVRAPAPTGHFLREFGQSDRELIDNGNPDATVGQALMMMNGDYFKGLANPFSTISRTIEAAGSAEDAVQDLYLTLLSRAPTAEETELLTPILESDPREGPRQALWALLNTKQFLFIQ